MRRNPTGRPGHHLHHPLGADGTPRLPHKARFLADEPVDPGGVKLRRLSGVFNVGLMWSGVALRKDDGGGGFRRVDFPVKEVAGTGVGREIKPCIRLQFAQCPVPFPVAFGI